MIRAVIIDDEQHCINRLTVLLNDHCKQTIHIAGAFSSVEDGLSGILILKPDLVFLDIKLNDLTGFDLLNLLPQINFEIIFTTVYDNYAVKAFRFSALDYLLKPIVTEELLQAVSKFQRALINNDMTEKISNLFYNLRNNTPASKRIAVPTNKGLIFFQLSDILRCQADVNYTTFHLTNGKTLTVAKTLKEVNDLLADYQFFRIHNSHIINLNYIKSYHKGNGGYIVLTDNTNLEVSSRRKELFFKKIDAI
jgi:two-component system LytT family response regulator